ncbi:MAG TPA: DUF4097 family beta strand repeat-containing protein [Intrasporangium sp.]|uniref:DUF4097 family beta strand repeat-containing protein n=1 Tax=Intrasporangium sp. TaxID=1925024 RepID=UPI002B499212|nr:DUF4097 family beta strand repeat-containing protein [Intrasporangium sp.]HKX66708.1 DUF4097 family beta strand repeat-containing protein [Intrasporangium sp.]
MTSTPSAPSPGGSADTPTQGPFLPRPTMPPATDVPDDRIHGDSLEAAPPPSAPSAPPGPPQSPPSVPQSPLPTSAPPRGRSRGPWLGLAGVGLALVIGSFGVITESKTETEVRPFTGDTISFAVGSNDVQVLGGAPAGKIEVTRQFEWGLGGTKPTPNETWDADGVAISEADCQGVSWRCGVDYIVRVPDDTAVELRGGSGDVVLSGSLGVIDAEVGSGDLEADGLSSADVRLQTGSGDVDLGLLPGAGKVDVRTGSGDMELSLDSDAASVLLRAGSGDIDLELPSAPDSLDIETGSGDVSIDAPDAEQFRLDVDTGSGDQDVDVPSSATADHLIKVSTGSGDVEIN